MEPVTVFGTLALCCLFLVPALLFRSVRRLHLGRRLARLFRHG